MITKVLLGDALTEVKDGIGADWAKYLVLGATRAGVAPAKESPGKQAERYKPVFPGTIFYNPMRILIGSIAFIEDDDTPGITSPDYVVFRGKEGKVDSRWFYYWLRSPLGHQCILSLARGAVRERMLFARLAEAEVEIPDFETQKKYSRILATAQKEVRAIKEAIAIQLHDVQQLPHRLIAESLETFK